MDCAACQLPIAKDELLVCSGCRRVYDYKCLCIPEEYFKTHLLNVNHKWCCTSCTNVTRRHRGDGTPVRRHYELSPPQSSAGDMSVCDENEAQHDCSSTRYSMPDPNSTYNNATNVNIDVLSNLLDAKLAGVKRDLVMIDAKIGTTKQELFKELNVEFNRVIDRIKKEFTDTTDHLSAQIKGFQVELTNVNKKVSDLERENARLNTELLAVKNNPSPPSNITELQITIDQMQSDLNERDQVMLLNDVELTGVPEYQGESTVHITQALAQKLGMQLESRDVVSAERVGPSRVNSSGDSTRPRTRPLVVRLARRSLRDDLIRNARIRRSLDSNNIGLPDHTPSTVYINERLTKINRNLFWKARQAGKAAGWKFIWTREGRVYARKTVGNDSRGVRIHSEKDIMRVFGVDPSASNII